MEKETTQSVKLSVRQLVEFLMRSGNLDTSSVGVRDTDAMQKGSKLHRKIQRSMKGNYEAEYFLSCEIPLQYEENQFQLIVEGRADGIIKQPGKEPEVVIDEIKGMYADIFRLEEPIGVHLAQAKCYAYMYATKFQLKKVGVRMTYCHLETELTRHFNEVYTYEEICQWFEYLTNEYAKWASLELAWKKERNESIKALEFPFDYRPGQKKLVTGVYQTILRGKKLYIEAPTGVGKTISTVFPAVKAMGENKLEKVFYLTAKTITRTVAEETFRILREKGAKLKVVTITAKDKTCVLDKVSCNPIDCERAKGHYDRVNDAMYDLLIHEHDINRNLIEEYAQKHMVCPFEMCLDVTMWADCIICDYNYVFDPNVYLRRFFGMEKKLDCVFLVDEAHNLVERAREMYSATIVKEQLLQVKEIIRGRSNALEKKLELCNRDLLSYKREYSSMARILNIDSFIIHCMQLLSEFDEFLQEYQGFEGREEIMDLYFELRHFLNIASLLDEKYEKYVDYRKNGEFFLRLQCMDPSTNLQNCLERGKCAVFFSATLLPIAYYKEQLAGKKQDYAIYAETPFQTNQRLLMIANDVSTIYARRNEREYRKIASYILEFVGCRKGNYMVFFPSYQYMQDIYDSMVALSEEKRDSQEFIASILMQSTSMTEADRESFLDQFQEGSHKAKVGFCVMGGIFSEGIDLKKDRLIGVAIVGTGLPMVCNEKELFREYYEREKGAGFDYAYLYNGMNKVLQSAGRVIRTIEDKGAILLLDQRFTKNTYQELFPKEWYPHYVVNETIMKELTNQFWEGTLIAEHNQGD